MATHKLDRHPFYRFYLVLLLFIGVNLFGIAGFMIIEHYTFIEALYMTVITVATVGFEEVHPLSNEGRIFTVVLILLILISISFSISYVTRFFLDGNFQRYYKTYKMNQTIQHLRNHVILCGFGRNGQAAAKVLQLGKVPFVVIERDQKLIDEADFPVDHYLLDDATKDETLLDAGIQQAKAIIVALPDDADNVFIVLTSRELNPSIKIISRASNDTSVRKLKTAGATNVIMPDKIGGSHMATLILNPDVKEFIDYMAMQSNDAFHIREIEVTREIILSELDCWKKTGATILGLKTSANDYLLNPSAETKIKTGYRLIAMGSEIQLQKIGEMVK